MQIVPKPAKILLDLIGKVEAKGDYNTIIGFKQHLLAKPLTQMTTKEVLDQQKTWPSKFKVPSGAAGRYQIIRKTLLSLAVELKLEANDVFSPEYQDWLGYKLLQRRGYDKWIQGQISDTQFMRNLSMEWASFPVPETGRSYYDGDGINASLVSIATVAAKLKEAKAAALEPEPVVVPVEPPAKELEAMIQVLLPMLIQQLLPLITQKVTEAVNNPRVPIDSAQPHVAAAQIAKEVVRSIETTSVTAAPVAANTVTGNVSRASKNVFQSPVALGNIISMLFMALAVVKPDLAQAFVGMEEETSQMILLAFSAGGQIWSFVARVWSKLQPLYFLGEK